MEAQLDRDRVWDRPDGPSRNRSRKRPGRGWASRTPIRSWARTRRAIPGARTGTGPQAAADRTPRDRNPGRQGSLDQGRNPQVLQGLDQGSSSGHERRRPLRRGTPAGGRLGLGPDQGQPELPRLGISGESGHRFRVRNCDFKTRSGPPEGGGEKHQHHDQFQPPQQHGAAEDPLRGVVEAREIARRPDLSPSPGPILPSAVAAPETEVMTSSPVRLSSHRDDAERPRRTARRTLMTELTRPPRPGGPS
jgi:hypothetical protein